MPDDVCELLGRRVRLVDLSRPLAPTPSEPTPMGVTRISHEDCAATWEALYGIPPAALPLGGGFAGEFLTLSTHDATHADAPWHYAPLAEGRPAWTIDEVPLGWFVGPAVVLDVSDLGTGRLVFPADIDARLARLGRAIAPGDVVLFRTGADAAWGTPEFFAAGCGLGREAVLHLVGQGVRLLGTDAWSLDRPYPLIAEEWRAARDPARLWPAHFAGIERRYCHLEKLANLEELPAVGATLLALPIKVAGGSGAWVRAVGLVPA